MEHLGTRRLDTPRLILRPFRPGDGEAMFRNWANDPLVTRYLTWPPHENAEVSERLCALWAQGAEKPSFYQWAIELRELGQVIGSLSVVRTDEATESAELGYCIGRAWWGRGLMTEAVRAVIAYLLTDCGFRRVCACHDAENPASGRVMLKSGMTREGTLRASGRNNRGIVDLVWYSVLQIDPESPNFP